MTNILSDILHDGRTPLALIVFYFIGNLLSVFNYSFYMRFETARYGESAVTAHLVFVVIGGILYILWASVHWMWSAKYVESRKERLRRLGYGIWCVFLTHDLPLLVIEWHVILCCGGLRNGLQGVAFVFLWFEFILSFVFAWTCYTWRMARFMNYWYGEDTSGVAYVTRRELEDAVRRSSSPAGAAPSLPIYETEPYPRITSPPTARLPRMAPLEPLYVPDRPQPRLRPYPEPEVEVNVGAMRPVSRREADAFDRDYAEQRSTPPSSARRTDNRSAPYGSPMTVVPRGSMGERERERGPRASAIPYGSPVGTSPRPKAFPSQEEGFTRISSSTRGPVYQVDRVVMERTTVLSGGSVVGGGGGVSASTGYGYGGYPYSTTTSQGGTGVVPHLRY